MLSKLVNAAINREANGPTPNQRVMRARCWSELGQVNEAESELRLVFGGIKKSFGNLHVRRTSADQGNCGPDEGRRSPPRGSRLAGETHGRHDRHHRCLAATRLGDSALDLGLHDRLESYCQEVAARVSDRGEQLNTRVIAYLFQSLSYDGTDQMQLREFLAEVERELKAGRDALPDDYGMSVVFTVGVCFTLQRAMKRR